MDVLLYSKDPPVLTVATLPSRLHLQLRKGQLGQNVCSGKLRYTSLFNHCQQLPFIYTLDAASQETG